MTRLPKFIRDAQRNVDRQVLAFLREYGPLTPSWRGGGSYSIAWHNSLDRLVAARKVGLTRRGYTARKGARA